MARRLRIKCPGHAGNYHVITRTNGQDFKLDDHMKDAFVTIIKRLQRLWYIRYVAFTVMTNHYHMLVNLKDPEDVDPKEAIKRWNDYHDKEYKLNASVQAYREYAVQQLTDVSSFMKRLNILMTREYNRHTGKAGTLWQSRFHSTIFERGYASLQCAAYIELNSFRASMVNKPEDYEYSSLHYLKQGNKEGLIDIELLEEGLDISGLFRNLTDKQAFTWELYNTYLAYVYEAGTEPKGGKERGIVVTPEMQERLSKYGIQGEKGNLATKAWDFSRSIFVGNSEYAQRLYDEYINPGYSGKERQNHIAQWLHISSKNLWSIFSVFHQGLPAGQRIRLPSRDGP